jgi:hypothetical protein
MSLIAEKQLLVRWNPDANNAAHQRADRIFAAGTMRAWVPMLKGVIAQVLLLFDDPSRDRVLFRPITDQQWALIEGRVDKLFSHKIWDDPSPDVVAQLKIKAVEQVRNFMASRDSQLDSGRRRGLKIRAEANDAAIPACRMRYDEVRGKP